LIQFVDRAGAALLDRFDRNAPEIALLLVDKPQESALALDVMQYLAELGDAAALQDGRARISTAPVVPARLRAPVDALFAWLERRGSAELKTDLLEIRAAYNRLKDQHLLDLERNAPSRVETAPREPTGVKRSELNPMSRTALANPALQSLARVSRPR
jgi:hypothetical protein